jgi:hypothetical protein
MMANEDDKDFWEEIRKERNIEWSQDFERKFGGEEDE